MVLTADNRMINIHLFIANLNDNMMTDDPPDGGDYLVVLIVGITSSQSRGIVHN